MKSIIKLWINLLLLCLIMFVIFPTDKFITKIHPSFYAMISGTLGCIIGLVMNYFETKRL